jgi:hypothetical protein
MCNGAKLPTIICDGASQTTRKKTLKKHCSGDVKEHVWNVIRIHFMDPLFILFLRALHVQLRRA